MIIGRECRRKRSFASSKYIFAMNLPATNDNRHTSPQSNQLGLWIFLGVIAMLFACFTSAIIVRRASGDWLPVALPSSLWLNTAVLLASSVTLEWARRAARNVVLPSFRNRIAATLALAVVFVVGQFVAWQQLAASGMLLPTNPHAAFFYILSGLHLAHVLGGLGALLYVSGIAWFGSGFSRAGILKGTASYWHFMAATWLWVFAVLLIL
jgi:cytochrome c oxidase subunit 3